MTTIVTIVEGYGEVSALPILLRNLLAEQNIVVDLPRPKNAHGRTNLITSGGLEKFLELARRDDPDGALVLIDTEGDCPTELAWDLGDRASQMDLPFPVAIVCAHQEYESWILASLETVAGLLSPSVATYEGDPEGIRDAKGWLSAQMRPGRAYKPTLDQASLTSKLDFDLVRGRSRSFRRLEHAIEELLTGESDVTPKRPD